MTNAIKEIFLGCFKNDNPNELVFSANAFFSEWFRKKGTPYVFLFKKNLTTTNIQFAELVSLIKLHTTNRDTKKRQQTIHFVMVSDFLNSVQKVVDDLARSGQTKEKVCETFLNLYTDVLQHMVLLDVFYGSCSVLLPPHMQLDLFSVCGESGYIHSCGRSVYTRALAQAEHDDFISHVTNYVKSLESIQKILLVVYSHEDFTQFDRDFAADLRNGLDDVKLYVEKYTVGNKSLLHVLRELQESNTDRLHIAPAGDYRKHPKIIEKEKLRTDRTIWLIIDRTVTSTGQMGEDKFLVCYDQYYKNKNPLHIFDENKPAWVAHTTIPHTLTGAMINVTRPLWLQESVSIYDPFAGTGTTALEALKFDRVRITCNDKSPIAPLLIQDNLDFFASTKDVLDMTLAGLGALSFQDCREYHNNPKGYALPSSYEEAKKLFESLNTKQAKKEEWFDIPDHLVEDLGKVDPNTRIRFYLALRAELRHVLALRGEQWLDAYSHEAKGLSFQTSELCELRAREIKETIGGLTRVAGVYSDGCSLNADIFKGEAAGKKLKVLRGDASKPPPGDEQYDVVITDPPYGFNNDIDMASLAQLLSQAIDSIFLKLKPTSQLIIAIPDHSHSGKRIPLFATRVWMTAQILAKAEKHNFEAFVPDSILPRFGHLFQAPYYWNSEKALKRCILHFQFRRKQYGQKETTL